MPYVSDDGDFERIFMTTTEFVDQFVGSSLQTWGANVQGQLGTGNTTQRLSPGNTAGGGTNWKESSGGGSFLSAIKTDGTLWSCGFNTTGQLGDGTTLGKSSPVTTAGGGTNWKQVSCGYVFTAAIKTDGTLWTWGTGGSGQLGNLVAFNTSSPGTTSGGGTNWKQVSCGNAHAAAIKTDGTLWTWGSNSTGQLGDSSSTTTNRSSPVTTSGGGTDWKQVSCGNNFCAAIKTDGTLWTWGGNNNGALGTGNTTSRSSPGTTAVGGANWKQVSGGRLHNAAIKTDGTLWTWGLNASGQLGDGTTTSRNSPGTIAGGGTNWKQVSASPHGDFSAAVKTDGTLWTWGRNLTNQLGDGTTTSRTSPIQPINNLSSWKKVNCGYNFTTAVAQI